MIQNGSYEINESIGLAISIRATSIMDADLITWHANGTLLNADHNLLLSLSSNLVNVAYLCRHISCAIRMIVCHSNIVDWNKGKMKIIILIDSSVLSSLSYSVLQCQVSSAPLPEGRKYQSHQKNPQEWHGFPVHTSPLQCTPGGKKTRHHMNCWGRF